MKLREQLRHFRRTDQCDETRDDLAKLQITKKGIDFAQRGPQREAEESGRETRIGDPEISAPPVIGTEYGAFRPNYFLCRLDIHF